jgi:hypothetical protein
MVPIHLSGAVLRGGISLAAILAVVAGVLLSFWETRLNSTSRPSVPQAPAREQQELRRAA